MKLTNLLLAVLKLTLESGNAAGHTQVNCYGAEDRRQDASIITQNNLADRQFFQEGIKEKLN